MIMHSKLLTAAFALALGTIPALAGGPTLAAGEPAPADAVSDWQGLHFGISTARPNGDNFWAERGIPSETAAGDWSGTLPTFSLGYDWQRGKLVFGVTLAVSSGDLMAEPTTGGGFGCFGCQTTIDKLKTLRGRVGYALGKTLVYATAGSARADGIGTAGGGASVSGEDSLTGWTAGIGVERYVGRKITLSAEYLQTDLGRLELPIACGSRCYTDISFGLLQLGVNYRW